MTHPSDLTQQVIARLMNLQEFTVSVPVENGWLPSGRAPFDIRIANGLATVTVPALTEEEARDRVTAYFSSGGDED